MRGINQRDEGQTFINSQGRTNLNHEILCYLSHEQDLYHASHLYTGLCGLMEQGMARVKFVVPRAGEKIFTSDSLTICLKVRSSGGKDYLLAIDLRDHSDVFALPLLEICDVYLKRSYYEPDLSSVPDTLRRKIIPFGLNYGCRSRLSTRRIFSALIPNMAASLLRSPKTILGQLNPRRSILYQYMTTALEADFEQRPEAEVEATVLFQTRVYEPDEICPDDPFEVNDGRVRLVRALREAFREKFRGGLVPTAYAKEHYPDAISEQPTRQSQYIAWGKQSLVGIYTRGLYHSLAFKLPEYLASAKCIVSEPLRNNLPRPLVAGEHYMEFRTPEECIAHCARLLEDETLARALRRQAWNYYQREVKPTPHLDAVLSRALPASWAVR
jgi:hypothetical protein